MSTIKVTNIEHASTGNGGIQLDNAGHVTVDGVQMPTAGPLSNRNLVINGAMNVAQRGTSSTSTAYQTVDRFSANWGQGAVTQTQEDLTTGDPFDSGFNHFFRLQNTTASTAGAAYREVAYKFEGQDIRNSGWTYKSSSSYITLSFWVRASVAQDYYGFVESQDGTSRIYTFPFTLAADTWTFVTETIPGDSSMQVDNDNGFGFLVDIVAFNGTNYTDSSNTDRTWRNRSSAGDFMLDMTNTWANTANATFDVTGVQLEVGEKATPFEHRSFADELAKCQRYCYILTRFMGNNQYPQVALSSGSISGYVNFPVQMRTTPTLSSGTTLSLDVDKWNATGLTQRNFRIATDKNGISLSYYSTDNSNTSLASNFFGVRGTGMGHVFSAEL
tara:strand:+ start:1205 stop:2365 length:1161 start_codon:yes stop_codon:yes gene_type:complete